MTEGLVSAFAPGRVELLGNHTDYNQGVVLGAAIDRGIAVSGSSRDDQTITLRSTLAGEINVALRELQPQREPASRWGNYSLGVAHELLALGVPVKGFTAYISGDLPAGNGLSSSAALEVATALFLLKLHHHSLPPLDLARMCQRAEQSFVGVRSGLLDQVCSLFGQKNCALLFDARSEEVRRIPFPPEVALVIAQSGMPRELASGKYNQRRAETGAAAEALGVRALRDANSQQIENATGLSPLLRRRALHITGENERVWKAVALLERGDVAGFGRLMYQSHQSSRVNFENSSPELDLLVQIASELPGVFGARLTGGGFGGATVSLCAEQHTSEIAGAIQERYLQQTGCSSIVFVCRVEDGAR